MEENFHSINAIKNMEVIDIDTGSKAGYIKDIKVNFEEQKVISLILPGEISGWFSKTEDIEVLWENVIKVGVDVMIVKFNKSN
jgi:YlmC/YmxH family sporulation protein